MGRPVVRSASPIVWYTGLISLDLHTSVALHQSDFNEEEGPAGEWASAH